MTALDVLQQLHEPGVILTPSPDSTVCCRAPTGVLAPALLDAMRQHKQELYAVVEDCEERAAIAQYCIGLPRPEAEALAWTCVRTEQAHAGCTACGYPDGVEATL